MNVRFPKDPTPMEAKNVRMSQRHDVALIKVEAVASLPYVRLDDSYTRTRQGDPAIVLGYAIKAAERDDRERGI